MKNAFRIKANKPNPKKNKTGEINERKALLAYQNSKYFGRGFELKRIEIAVLDKFPIVSCMPDAIAINRKTKECICVEVKTWRGFVPPEKERMFYYQVQLQMAITKLDRHALIIYNNDTGELKVWKYKYNHSFVLQQMKRIRFFFFEKYFPLMADILLFAKFVKPSILEDPAHREKDYRFFVEKQLEWKKTHQNLYYKYELTSVVDFPTL